MKCIMSLMVSAILLVSCQNSEVKNEPQKDSDITSNDSLIAYNFDSTEVKLPLTPELKKILETTSPDCLDSFPINAVDAPITLPNPGRPVTLHDITNSGSFTVGCQSCNLTACVSGQWNPRYFNPKDIMKVWYGNCFRKSKGNVRACRTAYGWRVEGDKEKDGTYEGVLKIILQ